MSVAFRLAGRSAGRLAGICALALCVACTAETPADADEGLSREAEAQVRTLIREHLIENPEILEEAITALQQKREAETRAEAQTRVLELADQIYRDPRDVSIGPADAPVTVVEFFDYNCGFCRASTPFIQELIDTHGDRLRVVFKESPVLGEGSRQAAHWAIAAREAGSYVDAHFALMEASQRLDAESASAVLSDAGVDVAAIEAARQDEAANAQMDEAVQLLQIITGGRAATPTFVINDAVVSGADFDQLTALIDAALAEAE